MLDTLIIGAGPAGLTAFYYALLYELNTECIGNTIGGKLLLAPFVSDFPGISNIKGSDYIHILLMQIQEFKREPQIDDVVSVTKENDIYKAMTKSGKTYETKTVIIATGNGNKQRENQAEKLASLLQFNLENGRVKIDQNNQTSLNNIFAAGDCTTYPDSIEQLVSAVASGAHAAASISEKLTGQHPPIVWGKSKIQRF